MISYVALNLPFWHEIEFELYQYIFAETNMEIAHIRIDVCTKFQCDQKDYVEYLLRQNHFCLQYFSKSYQAKEELLRFIEEINRKSYNLTPLIKTNMQKWSCFFFVSSRKL